MPLTNKYGAPPPLVAAVEYDTYDPGECDYTATSLIRPPQMRQLEQRYHDQITEDVADRIWLLLGKMGHSVLEVAKIAMEQEENK